MRVDRINTYIIHSQALDVVNVAKYVHERSKRKIPILSSFAWVSNRIILFKLFALNTLHHLFITTRKTGAIASK